MIDTKKTVKIKFVNGLDFQVGIKDILNDITSYYNFIDSDEPDFIVFGPYGSDLPVGNFVKIGYYCENFIPDMTICDWAFGIPYEKEVKHPKYMRIQWHGFDPNSIIKKDVDIENIISNKTKFCNFIYSNKVKFRETFYKELSKYKRIDAPGKSMNNMQSIDSNETLGNIWHRKRKFLSQYKFTIAFENYSYPGYNTEKLTDPMMVNSIPIYLGNPSIERHFNTKSFINGYDYVKANNSSVINFLESTCQQNFRDVRPTKHNSIADKITRKLKTKGREIKIKLQYNYNFDKLIEKVIEIDKNDSLYAQYISEPWFYNNTPPSNEHVINRWKQIFE